MLQMALLGEQFQPPYGRYGSRFAGCRRSLVHGAERQVTSSKLGSRRPIAVGDGAEMVGRVEMWRGDRRCKLSVAAPVGLTQSASLLGR